MAGAWEPHPVAGVREPRHAAGVYILMRVLIHNHSSTN